MNSRPVRVVDSNGDSTSYSYDTLDRLVEKETCEGRWQMDYTRTDRIRRLARSIDVESGSWAFLYNFDQYIYQEQEDTTQGVGVFGRLGISDGKANPVDSFYSIGIGGKGVLPGRDQDRFGIGYFYTEYSDVPVLEALGINNTQGVELFYNIEITPWLHITPDLQVIIKPGGRADRDVAIVYGIRAQMSF